MIASYCAAVCLGSFGYLLDVFHIIIVNESDKVFAFDVYFGKIMQGSINFDCITNAEQ